MSLPPSPDYRLTVNGEPVPVHACPVANYAPLSADGPLEIEIEARFPFERVKVRPSILGVEPEVDGPAIRFRLDGGRKVSVELDDELRRPLLLFANPPEEDRPDPGDPSVRYYPAGLHEAGEVRLGPGQTAYLEEGAVVSGWIVGERADGASVRGRGILDGSRWRDGAIPRRPLVQFVQSEGVTVEGITLVDGPSWHVVPIACRDVTIRGLGLVTINGTGDGIDLVGCEDVLVEDCFVRSKDDCLAIKAVGYQHESGCKDVRNVLVRRSVFWNAEWGNAIEIGYETRCDRIEGIVFSDCDVIRCEVEGWQSGGTFTIHNGDRALVRDVLYEDIRVEDSREKLIDLKILHSVYSRDPERGRVQGIRFKDIRVLDGPFPVSILQGYDKDHLIEDVTIEGLTVHGRKVGTANEARMVAELTRDLRFL